MRKSTATLIIFLIFISTAYSQTLRIDIKGKLKGSSNCDIFHGQMLLPVGESVEIFTGPYTLKLTAAHASQAPYDIAVSASSLGPDYHNEDFKFLLSQNDPMIIPPLPVKNDVQVLYTLILLDDTSKIDQSEPDPNDTTKWGISETIHYRTHWLKNSLADFMWNIKIGYLEEIYDQYRGSFDLSSFEKIDLYLHPEPTNSVYINPENFYAIQPRIRRIDLVYGNEIDAADPRPGAELLIYRMWGYGPRWMVTGLAGYYFDNDLQVNDYIDRLNVKKIETIFGDEFKVDSDTGREIAGAFVHWLTDTQNIVRFTSLFRQSTTLDFTEKFNRIYGESLDKAISDFIDHMNNFEAGASELSYYASIYTAQGYYKPACEYYKELLDRKDKYSEKFRQPLGMCQFWAGDYPAALKTFNYYTLKGDSLDGIYMAAKISMAIDDSSKQAQTIYKELIGKKYSLAIIDWATILLDRSKTDSASAILKNMNDKEKDLPQYNLTIGILRAITGQATDSILNVVATNALSGAAAGPQDPSFYLTAGRAFMYMGKYDKAKENLETSIFLEQRPYFIGQTLLELGRLMDLQGKRDEAKGYYKSIIKMNAGDHEKTMARKYLYKKYVIR